MVGNCWRWSTSDWITGTSLERVATREVNFGEKKKLVQSMQSLQTDLMSLLFSGKSSEIT